MRHAANALGLRPFGHHEVDLDVDFDRTPRPMLVTQLLERCTRSAGTDSIERNFLWDLPVGKRIECLFRVFASSVESEITIGLRCPDPACGEGSEVSISTEALAELQKDAYTKEHVEVSIGGDVVALRRPTGSDQLAWLESTFTDSDAARRAMVRTLVHHGDEAVAARPEMVPDDCLDGIEEAMEDNDPLVNFKLGVTCPGCEATSRLAIDLEALALRGLRSAQLRLLAAVHRLAAHYHWSEQQIFAVPVWRRAQYLRLIARESSP